jgi:cytochrome c-type biogenesis protein CcmH/NrfF
MIGEGNNSAGKCPHCSEQNKADNNALFTRRLDQKLYQNVKMFTNSIA